MNNETEFSALDRKFGDFLQAWPRPRAAEVRLAAMCASRARAERQICVPLAEIAIGEDARDPRRCRRN